MKSFKKLGVLLGSAFIVLCTTAVNGDVIVDGSALPSGQIQSITINPASGDVNITTTGGDWEIAQTDVGPSRPVVSLRVNSSSTGVTVDVNTSVNFSWNTSGADSCNASGGGSTTWSGTSITPITSGSASVTILDVGTQTFTLSCTNAEGTTVDSVTVTGRQVDEPPEGCDPVSNVTVIDWTDLRFAGNEAEWPRLAGVTALLSQGRGEIVAIRFNTITAEAVSANYGKITNLEVAGMQGDRDIALSACPGQFADLPRRCSSSSIVTSGSVYWELDNARGYSHTCKLDKGAQGATYYLNVRFPDDCGDATTCQSYISPYYYR